MTGQRKSIYEYDRSYYEKSVGRYYTDGNTARALNHKVDANYDTVDYNNSLDYYGIDEQAVPIQKPERRTERHVKTQPVRKIRRKSSLDITAYLLLTVAMAVTLMVCVSFLQTKSSISDLSKQRKLLMADYTSLKDANDALENELNAPIDYDYLYAVAVGKLGMVYPNQEQIVSYKYEDTAYVVQYDKIPEVKR